MKKFLSKITFKVNLTIYIASWLFIMYLITTAITWVLISLIISLGWINEDVKKNPFIIITITLVACIIIGTFIAPLASRKIFKSIKKFMNAMNQLASGDFSARLNITHPPEYKVLSENFNRMAEELGGIEVLRTDFINNFSHEFKTPIVSIKGFAEILKDDRLTKEERNEYLDIVIEESTRLSSLATNVLTLSKVETQSILTDKQFFNLGEQLRQCILILDSKLIKKDIILNLDIHDYFISGNKEMLNQVWLNLLDNAIKFSLPQGIVEVRMKEQNDSIIVTITDTGCGITKDSLPKIFDKFYQEDASHGTMGNGLGLSIVHKIVTLHKGTIKCESTISKGTSFTISLPIK
ncbi:MAG: HAMP domain-containing histidine kinase, partial [Turicibacter sp.]|nr:HAMP domain-containing histidine kinase [Turicibacter sp.]